MDEYTVKSRGLSSGILKYIAIISMFIDHLGASVMLYYTSYMNMDGELFKGADSIYSIMRMIGRTAFPVYCFLLVEGFFHTKSIRKYLARMFAFCFLSEVPFDLAIFNVPLEFGHQNVFFTLFLGLLAMDLIQKIKEGSYNLPVKIVLEVVVAIGMMSIAYFLKTDYDAIGVGLILVFYFLREKRLASCVAGYCTMIWEVFSFPAFILIYFYNGKKGKGHKYFFYFFYPVHLLLLWGLRVLLFKQY